MMDISSQKTLHCSKQIFPLQFSAIGNGAAITSKTSSKVQRKKACSGTDSQIIMIWDPDAPIIKLKVSLPKHNKDFSAGRPALQYQCHLLSFAESTPRAYGNQQCAAIFGSTVTLSRTIGQQSEWDNGLNVAHTHCEVGHDSYLVDNAHNLNGDMGMLAQTYISQGGVVLVEHPVLVLPTNMALDASVFGLEESGSYHKALISHLDDQVKREIYSSKDCSTSVNGSTPMGILTTNGLNIELEVNDNGLQSQDKKYQALFLKTSRCNHRPNAIWRFDHLTFTLTLSAV
ncbi:uncharacterized protein C8R40DRAFT_1073447 [Lentinula edodes]|uniref:uncharacterized protein n=1 Tax=Lentinula edodes TaxID=5353 RepID=UPI001E8DCB68|nr:uncharacterized protein C8R40DRAFT_1073447 [Lentinula edodes]KAH7870182.1 hypothetical protein C8R40DRAFT_1073447 [Lentinula edodes]